MAAAAATTTAAATLSGTDKKEAVQVSKPVVETKEAVPEDWEDNRIGYDQQAMEGADGSDEDSDDATEAQFEYPDDQSLQGEGDQDIDSKEAWIDAMVDFIWQAKDASELAGTCPELASWLNVWNDADDETCKKTCREMAEVVQYAIVTLAEKRSQYYFDMQAVESTAAQGNIELAESAFKQVGAYAENLRAHFSDWIRHAIKDKLDVLAEARNTAVADGVATNKSVKIAKSKLRAKIPRIKGTDKGRKQGGDTRGSTSSRTRKSDKEKKKKAVKDPALPKGAGDKD